jgi:hypothetical protein
MDIAAAFLVLAFLSVAAGVLLLSIPAGLVVIGVMLSAAGVALLPTKPPTKGP